TCRIWCICSGNNRHWPCAAISPEKYNRVKELALPIAPRLCHSTHLFHRSARPVPASWREQSNGNTIADHFGERAVKIVILGAGQVGASVAENLVSEANDITIVDTNAERLRALQDRMDLRTVHGNAAHPAVLEEAGARDADLILAVT